MLTATRPHPVDPSLPSLVSRLLAADPAAPAVAEGDVRLTHGELLDRARRVAAGLQARGVAPGDRVVVQLPNWWETIAVSWGVLLAGAVLVPIVPIYRARELRFVLDQVQAAAVVAPEEYRGHRHADTLRSVLDDLGSAAALITVRGGPDPLEALFALDPLPGPVDADPDAIAVVLYTSGTTADPKGALHSHRTLLAEARDVAAHCGLGGADTVFMGSPLSHITGLSYGIVMPVDLGVPVVLQERWDADAAADLIERHGCTFTVSATPFLSGLADVYSRRATPSRLRVFVCGGADIPADLVRRAHRVMGTTVLRTYGSTEGPTSTMADPHGDPDVEAQAEGRAMGGNEIELRPDVTGAPELCIRGPEMFLGYLDATLNEVAFDADGFFHTGDLATIEDGRLRIVGRIKDVINRGGEKFSAAEIEAVLAQLSGVRDVAVVACPDPVLVERACACLVVDGPAPDINALREAVLAAGLAVQKTPELLLVLEDLPRTPSGKIQRFLLRDRVVEAAGRGELIGSIPALDAQGEGRGGR